MFVNETTEPVILIVDDMPSNIHLINEAVKGLGKCVFATDGRSALQAAYTHHPTLILLDVEMPDLDGYDVCRLLKADAQLQETPIIFITSHAEPAYELRALQLGAVDFIPKPIVPEIARARAKTQLLLQQQRIALGEITRDLNLLVSSLPVFVSYWNEGLVNCFSNDVNGQWFGLAPDSMRGQPLASVVGQSVAKLIQHQLSAYSLGDIPPFDISFVTQRRALCAQVSLVRRLGSAGELGYLMLLTDITERKRAEQSLAEEKERIRIMLNSIGDAVIATDSNGFVTFMNPIAEDLTDCMAKDGIGRPIENVMKLHDGMTGSRLQNPVRIALEDKRVVGMALNSRLHSAGQSIEVEDSAAPILDQQGALTGAIIVFHDVSEARAMALKMTHLAHHDPLTNLPNRILLQDRAHQSFQLARRENQRVAMILLDIDKFKEINDAYGHSVGDTLIKQVASQLQKELRGGDTLCRQGGDEFVVLVPKFETSEQVGTLTQRLVTSFQRKWLVGEREFTFTASAGVSVFPDDADDVEQLYRHADAAMYSAKQAGGNRFHFYSADIEAKQSLRRMLEHDLASGLGAPFVLLFQPKIQASTGAIVGAEALVRWRQANGELLGPQVFIPLAEETGLIIPLGKIIFQKACEQAAVWAAMGKPIRVAINVSAIQVEDPGFIDMVRELLTMTQVNPDQIEVEITESVFARDVDKASYLMRELKTMGIKIALDDFGTGYSSLSYIKNYPLDVLKIDQSFVRNMLEDPIDQSIIKTIIQLANNLALRVVAEGVETLEHANKLVAMGCDIMQGFYYARPLPSAEVTEYLLGNKTLPLGKEGS